MDILILGCGSIGSTLARAVRKMNFIDTMHLCDIDISRAEALAKSVGGTPCSDWRSVSGARLMVECASVSSAVSVVPRALENGMDVVVLSVGSLVSPGFLEEVERITLERGTTLYVPSGAVGSIDALGSARVAGLNKVSLTTVKHPRGFVGSKYLAEKGVDPENIRERTTVFRGSALEAVKAFPRNINVAATVGLAGIGLERTEVKIIADPDVSVNSHTIVAEGAFGRFESTFRNLPHPDNPKTSMLAALSAVRAVERYGERVKIGV